MSEQQTITNLMNTLNYLELAFSKLEGIEGMEQYQESIGILLMEVEMELQELVSVIG